MKSPNLLGPHTAEEWAEIQRQIGQCETLDDYRRTYTVVNSKVVETTPDLPHRDRKLGV